MEIRVDDTLIVCDAGSGIRELGLDLMKRGGPVVCHLFFSHAHWDHIQGFPFFTPSYVPGNTVYVYGQAEGDERFFKLISGQMDSPDYFPVKFSDLGANIVPSFLDNGVGTVDEVTVRCIEQQHPSLGYAFEVGGRKVVYATDSELDLLLADPKAPERDSEAVRQLPEDLVSFCRGADLLISDGQYTDEEYPSKAGWGHARATTAADLAVQAGVRQLALFHHDPMHADGFVDDMVATAQERVRRQGSEVFVFGAREGVELRIGEPAQEAATAEPVDVA